VGPTEPLSNLPRNLAAARAKLARYQETGAHVQLVVKTEPIVSLASPYLLAAPSTMASLAHYCSGLHDKCFLLTSDQDEIERLSFCCEVIADELCFLVVRAVASFAVTLESSPRCCDNFHNARAVPRSSASKFRSVSSE
jgi:hypothetical protein